MRMMGRLLVRALFGAFFSAWLLSCASIAELKVHYQLPAPSNALKGRRVVLVIKDARETKGVLGPGAREEFENFTGNITFSIARHQEQGFRMGSFQVLDMIMEGFKRKLETLGLEVLLKPSGHEPRLVIVLNRFLLELQNRTWVATATYDARLEMSGKPLAMQTIDVQAERFKFWGRSGADTVMGDMFTDMVNRLNVPRLFQQANRS